MGCEWEEVGQLTNWRLDPDFEYLEVGFVTEIAIQTISKL